MSRAGREVDAENSEMGDFGSFLQVITAYRPTYSRAEVGRVQYDH